LSIDVCDPRMRSIFADDAVVELLAGVEIKEFKVEAGAPLQSDFVAVKTGVGDLGVDGSGQSRAGASASALAAHYETAAARPALSPAMRPKTEPDIRPAPPG
jgi:hypothetical protein